MTNPNASPGRPGVLSVLTDPTVVSLVGGVALLVVGVVQHDPELRAAGLAALGTGGLHSVAKN